MILKLENPKELANAVNIISDIVSEVKIKLTDEGVSIVAVDPANVAMVIFKLPKESFSQYEIGSDVWGVNLADLKQILRRASTSSSVCFEQEENMLKITIFDKVKRVFQLALVDVEGEEKDEPTWEFATEVEMDSSNFTQAVEDCAIVGDSCSLIAGSGFFVIEASGALNSARAEFSGDEAEIKGIAKSKYSIEYLIKFAKASRIADKVSIKFSDNHPLRIDYAGDKMGIGFVLAPRVENE
jgi:proliferating cell nuclear antigen